MVPDYVMDPGRFQAAIDDGTRLIGDIVWPSSQALAENLAGQYDGGKGWLASAFEGRRVLELGCGLGLGGLTVASISRPAKVLLTDREPEVVALTSRSVEVNGYSATSRRGPRGTRLPAVSTRVLDWGVEAEWPKHDEFDCIVATDVLYHGGAERDHRALISFLLHALSPTAEEAAVTDPGRRWLQRRFAVFVEPAHEERTTATDGPQFELAARDAGLTVDVYKLPGARAMQLIKVVSNAGYAQVNQ